MSNPRIIIERLLAEADIAIDGPRPWDIKVHDGRFFSRVLTGGSLALGESYMDGWWDCPALDEMCARAIGARLDQRFARSFGNLLALLGSLLFNQQTRWRACKVGRAHYDLGNEFFEAMLGPNMQYSCAHFAGDDDLAAAQRRKLETTCEKLRLRPGMQLLDIGCGWGGLARYAARHYGCRVVGITISREQQRYAEQFCRGLDVEIRLQDYREIRDQFDRVVSVGMIEHVGYRNYRAYMRAVFRSLGAGGLFVCQGIAANLPGFALDPWMRRYIFPNSVLPSLGRLARAAEGLFFIEGMENYGPHYDRTLLSWEENVRRAWPRFAKRFDERFQRMWRFYLLSCAGAFRARSLQVFQILFAKEKVVKRQLLRTEIAAAYSPAGRMPNESIAVR